MAIGCALPCMQDAQSNAAYAWSPAAHHLVATLWQGCCLVHGIDEANAAAVVRAGTQPASQAAQAALHLAARDPAILTQACRSCCQRPAAAAAINFGGEVCCAGLSLAHTATAHMLAAACALSSAALQNWWDGVEEKPAAVAIGVGALVALWATSGLVDAIDRLPIIGGLLEVVGLIVTGWFVYRYLLFEPDR